MKLKGNRLAFPITPGFYEYELSGGWKVLAGKSDRDNDILSFKLARPAGFLVSCKRNAGQPCIAKGKIRDRARQGNIKAASFNRGLSQ